MWKDEVAREWREYRLAEKMSNYDEEDFKNHEIRTNRSNPAKWEKDPNERHARRHHTQHSKCRGGTGTNCHQSVPSENWRVCGGPRSVFEEVASKTSMTRTGKLILLILLKPTA